MEKEFSIVKEKYNENFLKISFISCWNKNKEKSYE
jgi:hypothetical protein